MQSSFGEVRASKKISNITTSIGGVFAEKLKKVSDEYVGFADGKNRARSVLRPVHGVRSARAYESLSPLSSLSPLPEQLSSESTQTPPAVPPRTSILRPTNVPIIFKRSETPIRETSPPRGENTWGTSGHIPRQRRSQPSTTLSESPSYIVARDSSGQPDFESSNGSFRVIPMSEAEQFQEGAYRCTTANACGRQPLPYSYDKYPGMLEQARAMAIVRSESGSYSSIMRMVNTSLGCTDRVFVMTPWGNFVVFSLASSTRTQYFVFDGCTCDMNRFRFLDLAAGTAGLLHFDNTEEVIAYIMNSCEGTAPQPTSNEPAQPESDSESESETEEISYDEG